MVCYQTIGYIIMSKSLKRKKPITAPEIKEQDRSFNTWSKGNPFLAQTLPPPAPLLKPGERYLTAEEQAAAEADHKRPEDDPFHPDHGSARDVPMREMLDPDDVCFEQYAVWTRGYAPVLVFYRGTPRNNLPASPVSMEVSTRRRKATKRAAAPPSDPWAEVEGVGSKLRDSKQRAGVGGKSSRVYTMRSRGKK